MANATADLLLNRVGPEGHHMHLPVDGGAQIFGGTMVSALTATAQLVKSGTANSGPCIGVAVHGSNALLVADGVNQVKVETDRDFLFNNGTAADAFSDASLPGAVAYIVDDNTVGDNDNGATRQAAGIFQGMDSSGKVRVHITMRIAELIA